MAGRRFEDLQVWKKSHELAIKIYRASRVFPIGERYGLISQLRRAAVSVPTNVAEGSMAESRYLILLSRDLGYMENVEAEHLMDGAEHVERMLCRLRHKVGAPSETALSDRR